MYAVILEKDGLPLSYIAGQEVRNKGIEKGDTWYTFGEWADITSIYNSDYPNPNPKAPKGIYIDLPDEYRYDQDDYNFTGKGNTCSATAFATAKAYIYDDPTIKPTSNWWSSEGMLWSRAGGTSHTFNSESGALTFIRSISLRKTCCDSC